MDKDIELSNKLVSVQELIDKNDKDKKILIKTRNEIIKELREEGWGAIKIANHLNKTRDFVYKAIEKLEEE
jgi:predicted DNA-binding protein (MmcQ/YjbR family)